MTTTVYAGRFDFEDGGTYCGGWEDGKAHGHGVCTGPKAMGEFSGLWQFGYEVSGIYMWPSGNSFLGQWMSGKRHGLGVEKKQRWIYKGEWSQGFKGRYGVRISDTSGAKYEGTWANGLQDGYGSETYADGGTYFGQMSQGMRNGYGIRKSVSYGVASRYRSKDVKDSLTSLRSEEGDERGQRERDRRFDENRGGFVLRAKSDMFFEELSGYSGTAAYMPNGGAVGGNFITQTINSIVRRRRNSVGHSLDNKIKNNQNADNVSLSSRIMSKLKKSVSDIDEVNPMPSQNQSHLLMAAQARAKAKNHFRSMSSNNSVDSRCSNRTAPAGIGHLSSPSYHGFQYHATGADMRDDDVHSFVSQDEITDVNCVEIYMGEWKQDKRTGYGIAERSDGLKYEGEWFNNKKNGYGVTTFKDGTKEEGKYKNNVLITDKKKAAKMLTLRSSKFRQKIDAAVTSSLKSGQIAQQRADIALARAVNARTKAHAAEVGAKQARADSEYARVRAHEVAPDFAQPGEIKRLPEIVLDIDRMEMQGLNPNDPNNMFLNNQDNRSQKFQPMQDTNYMNWPQPGQQPPQQHQPMMMQPNGNQFNMTHSSTPPPLLRPHSQLHQQHQPTPTRQFSQNQQQQQQIYDNNNLLTPQQQQQRQQQFQSQQHSMEYNPINQTNQFSSNQLLMQQHQHPSIDPLTGQKINNEMLAMNQPDAQQAAPPQMQARNKLQQQQQYSFDEAQLSSTMYDSSSLNNQARMTLLQQAQRNSFNMDQLNNANQPTEFSNQQLEMQAAQQQQQPHQMFSGGSGDPRQRNQAGPNMDEFAGLSLQQQQQLLVMRNQQFLANNNNNSNINPDSLVQNDLLSASMRNDNGSLQQQQSQIPQQPLLGPGGIEQQQQQQLQETIDLSKLEPPKQPRRKSLPSIVKSDKFKEDEIAHSSAELNPRNQETFIIENGIKKRVIEKNNSKSAVQDVDENGVKRRIKIQYGDTDETPQLPRKMVIESTYNVGKPTGTTDSKRVSMPSINSAHVNPILANKVMKREVANKLSSERRAELRADAELQSNTSLRLRTMLKDVFLRNRIFLFIVLFNLSLAIWFMQMLK